MTRVNESTCRKNVYYTYILSVYVHMLVCMYILHNILVLLLQNFFEKTKTDKNYRKLYSLRIVIFVHNPFTIELFSHSNI